MKKVDQDKLLHLIRYMAGFTEYALTAAPCATARKLRNTAREIIIEIFPKSGAAREVAEWRKTSPDHMNTPPAKGE